MVDPQELQTDLEIFAIVAIPAVALLFMWWSWISDRKAPPGTKAQRNALFCAAVLITTSNAFFWALAAHNLPPHAPRPKPIDTVVLKGLVSAILGIMVAVFGKGRRTVALTVVAGIATFAFWALVFVTAGAGAF